MSKRPVKLTGESAELPSEAEPGQVPGSRAEGARATKVDCVRRQDYISYQLANGVTGALLVSRVATRFQVSQRQARNDVARARARWAAAIAADEPLRRATLLGVLDRVLAGAIADRCWSGAVAACREIARVLGLDAVTVRVAEAPRETVAHLKALAMTPAQRQNRLRELRAKASLPSADTHHDRTKT